MIRRELLTFLIVGTLTVVVDFLSYHGLSQVWSVDFAKAGGFVAGTVFAYFANRIWTFGHNAHASGTWWRFILLYAITLGANVFVNAWALGLTSSFAQSVQISFFLATAISAMLNFIGMKWFVFKQVKYQGLA